jgi:hypothetical protein
MLQGYRFYTPVDVSHTSFSKSTTMSTPDAPPPFGPPNVIELSSVEASKIVGVSLYSGRAEITRLYKFAVKTGQNQVVIDGLPDVLDHQSLR